MLQNLAYNVKSHRAKMGNIFLFPYFKTKLSSIRQNLSFSVTLLPQYPQYYLFSANVSQTLNIKRHLKAHLAQTAHSPGDKTEALRWGVSCSGLYI